MAGRRQDQADKEKFVLEVKRVKTRESVDGTLYTIVWEFKDEESGKVFPYDCGEIVEFRDKRARPVSAQRYYKDWVEAAMVEAGRNGMFDA
jgi:hypothetical protein